MTRNPGRAMRADARRNQQLILDVARALYVERGPDAALEEIARRAGVGIATLYRRFTDRSTLMRAVVLDALHRTADAAQQAIDGSADPFAALSAYMHAVIDLQAPAVIPTLLDRVDLNDSEIQAAREQSAALTQQLIDDARADGSLRADASFADIGLMLVRLSRPLPGAFTAEMQHGLAHRHLDLVLSGLHAERADVPLDGPALDLADLRQLSVPAASKQPPIGRVRPSPLRQ
jgi:AcrR family transcriptional regulator